MCKREQNNTNYCNEKDKPTAGKYLMVKKAYTDID